MQSKLLRWAVPSLWLLTSACGAGDAGGMDGGGSAAPDRDSGSQARDAAGHEPASDAGAATARVLGVVLDVRGNRLSGARVELAGARTSTGDDGSFELSNIPVAADVALLVTLDGYSQGRQRVTVQAGMPNQLRITLNAVERTMLEDPSAGGEVQSESGVSLNLPPNAIVDADGNAVSGPVEITFSLLNDRDEIAAAPGGLIAVNPENGTEAVTPLESFGMVEITLTAGGEEVNLSGDAEVELLFPLAPNHPFADGDTIGLWHFDEAMNLWQLVGEGLVMGDFFKANVTHFSWWNADQTLTKTCVRGRVLDSNGAALPGAQMMAEGRSYLGTTYGSSDAQGNYCVEARISSLVELSTRVRIGSSDQALAVSVNTPRAQASCDEPSSCLMLQDLVAVADMALCDPAQCPQEAGEVACCTTDLGPCAFVVNGDCGGNADGTWDEPTGDAGATAIPGVPMPPPPTDAGVDAGTMDAGTDAGTTPTTDAGTDAGTTPTTDAGTDAGTDSGTTTAPDAGTDSGTGSAGQGGTSGEGGSGGVSGTSGEGGASGEGGSGGTGGVTCTLSNAGDACFAEQQVCIGADVVYACTDGSTYAYRRALVGNECEVRCEIDGTATGTQCIYSPSTCGLPETWVDPCPVDCGFPEYVGPQFPDSGSNDGGVIGGSGGGGSGGDPMGGSGGSEADGGVILDGGMGGVGGGDADGGLAGSGGSGEPDGGVIGGSGGSEADGGMAGGSGGVGGGEPDGGSSVGVDRCGDVNALTSLEPVSSTTVGSTLINDWYDGGNCNQFWQGYERVYSVSVPAFSTLRARAVGAGMRTLIATSCADTNGSCVSADLTASYPNSNPVPVDLIVVVENALYDHQGPFTLYLSTDEPACGDNLLDYGESCDDGNDLGGDGCSSSCFVEPAWVCPADGSGCHEIVCGDGVIDGSDGGNGDPGGGGSGGTGGGPMLGEDAGEPMMWLPEQCDDSGNQPGDGCDAECQVEPSYICNGSPSVCTLRPEGDLCSNPLPLAEGMYSMSLFTNDYRYSNGPDIVFTQSFEPGSIVRVTGSSTFMGGAVLMNSNECPYNWMGPDQWFEPGDFELVFDTSYMANGGEPSGPMPFTLLVYADDAAQSGTLVLTGTSAALPVCGDGFVTQSTGEACDDGNAFDGDGCTGCTIDAGYVCPAPGQLCREPVCNDGMVEWPVESCEDGNLTTGDGCDADCRVEPGYMCNSWDPMPYCETRPAGDLCNNAEALPSGSHQASYTMEGFSSDDFDCLDCDTTRWFSIEQLPGEITNVFASGEFNGWIDVVAPNCPEYGGGGVPMMDGNSWFSPEYPAWLSVTNDGAAPRTLHLRVTRMQGVSGSQFELRSYTGAPGCGDGVNSGWMQGPNPDEPFTPSEACDDMNGASGDGCSATCQIEAGFRCPQQGPCAPRVCGDGVRDTESNLEWEQCDDGNTEPGDGCDATCLIEAGYDCSSYGDPTQCTLAQSGTACSNALPLPIGMANVSLGQFLPPQGACDGPCDESPMLWYTATLQPREIAIIDITGDYDGGASLYGTGGVVCGQHFYIDAGYFMQGVAGQLFAHNDGTEPLQIVLRVETYSATDTSTFQLDSWIGLPTEDCTYGEPCTPVVCGDGQVQLSEGCDDGELVAGDGCDENCMPEANTLCTGEPSSCTTVPAGDMCENAIALVDGNYGFSGLAPEPSCEIDCNARSRWFTVQVPAWNVFATWITSYDVMNGRVRIWDVSARPCWDLNSGGMMNDTNEMLAENGVARAAYVNNSPYAATLAMMVSDDAYAMPGSVDIAHTIEPLGCGDGYWNRTQTYGSSAEACDDGNLAAGDGCSSDCTVEPNWACDSGSCVQVVCGDGIVNGAEQCDDDELLDGDGCSSLCTVEPSYVCNGQPSVCYVPAPGELCENAEPLASGSYSLIGFFGDDECNNLCSNGPDRWFSVTVPGDSVLAVDASTTSLNPGRIYAFDVTSGSCDNAMSFGMRSFGPMMPTTLALGNPTPSPRQYRIAVADDSWEPNAGDFALTSTIAAISGCGDWYVDHMGDYGMPEECDDGNQQSGDGCSDTCMMEEPLPPMLP